MPDRCGPTHHNACDCREAAHAAQIASLIDERDALISENHDLTDERDEAIRERDAAREEASALRAAYDRMWLAQDGATTALVRVAGERDTARGQVATLLEAIAAFDDGFAWLNNAGRIDARRDLRATAAEIARTTGYAGGRDGE